MRNQLNLPMLLIVCSILSLATIASASTISCTGSLTAQYVTNVTNQISDKAPGITISQITDVGNNSINYVDVPSYSYKSGRIYYDHNGSTNNIFLANSDGTGAQIISAAGAEYVFVSADASLAYYEHGNGDTNNTGDLYAVHIAQSGNCKEFRLTYLDMKHKYPLGAIQLSTSSIDKTTNKNIIAFSPDNLIHRVRDDGTVLPTVSVPDKYSQNTFHRLRLNPVFPNIIWYKRNQATSASATPELWVVDLNNPGKVYSVSVSIPAGHPSWSADGLSLGYSNQNTGQWNVARVLNTNGSFAVSSSGTFTTTFVGPPFGASISNANYCTWASDNSVLVCTTGKKEGYKVYLMSLVNAATQFLTSTDALALTDTGTPLARFSQDKSHVIFRSDRTGSPENYLVTGFTQTIP